MRTILKLRNSMYKYKTDFEWKRDFFWIMFCSCFFYAIPDKYLFSLSCPTTTGCIVQQKHTLFWPAAVDVCLTEECTVCVYVIQAATQCLPSSPPSSSLIPHLSWHGRLSSAAHWWKSKWCNWTHFKMSPQAVRSNEVHLSKFYDTLQTNKKCWSHGPWWER